MTVTGTYLEILIPEKSQMSTDTLSNRYLVLSFYTNDINVNLVKMYHYLVDQ